MKNVFRRIGYTKLAYLTVLLGASTVLGFNCSGFAPMGGSDSNSSLSTPDGSIPVALLTSEQILKTMLSATGTESAGNPTPADDLILQTYNLRSGSLPSDKSITGATGPMLISVANLASAVCAKAVGNETAIPQTAADTRLFFREFDFSQGLSAQSNAAVVSAFDRLARNSWRRDATQDEEATISTMFSEFSQGSNMTDPAQTSLLATSICTAVLTSIDALTY